MNIATPKNMVDKECCKQADPTILSELEHKLQWHIEALNRINDAIKAIKNEPYLDSKIKTIQKGLYV